MVHPHQHCIDLCNRALEAVHSTIPDDLYRDIFDYINERNEWGLGMEILIDQISEYEIKISLQQFEAIEKAMTSMEMSNNNRMQYLRKHDVVA
ncbi:MAG: MafI family immunity protein [Planctomycetota bacterium]